MAVPEVKTILVPMPTSLGKRSRPLFRHALKLAGRHPARILLLHVVAPISDRAHATIQSDLQEEHIRKIREKRITLIKQTMKERLTKFCENELSDLVNSVGPHIEQLVVEGKYTDVIINSATQFDVDLIVMGSHDHLGRVSNTTRSVISYGKYPVMMISTGALVGDSFAQASPCIAAEPDSAIAYICPTGHSLTAGG